MVETRFKEKIGILFGFYLEGVVHISVEFGKSVVLIDVSLPRHLEEMTVFVDDGSYYVLSVSAGINENDYLSVSVFSVSRLISLIGIYGQFGIGLYRSTQVGTTPLENFLCY